MRDYHFRATGPAKNSEKLGGLSAVAKICLFSLFKRTSDITVNSIHIYEPCVLCHDALAHFEFYPPS